MVHRFVFTIKLNIDVNFAGHLNFVLMEEENQAVGIVVEEITVNTAKKKVFCIVCSGSQICSHNRQKSFCVFCCGSQICSHNRQKSLCKKCIEMKRKSKEKTTYMLSES